jgi:hypothetical protein
MLHVPTELPTLQEVLYWLYYDATKPQVTKNNICEGTDHLNAALSSGMTSLQAMVASARSVSWGSNEAVTLLYLVPWSPLLSLKSLIILSGYLIINIHS